MPLSDFYPEMEGWQPVPPENLSSVNPALPDPQTTINPYLRTTMPLTLQYQSDTLKQYNRTGLSSFRTAPLSPGSFPAVNSASASTATPIVKQATQTIITQQVAGDVEQILVTKLTGTSYTVQSGDNNTLLSFNNASGGTITLPSGTSGGAGDPSKVWTFNTLSDFDNHNYNITITANGGTQAFNLGATPAAGDLLLLHIEAGGTTNLSVSDNLGNSWHQVLGWIDRGDGFKMSLWWARSVIAVAPTVTVKNNDPVNNATTVAFELCGFTPPAGIAAALDKAVSATGSGTTLQATVIATGSNELIIGAPGPIGFMTGATSGFTGTTVFGANRNPMVYASEVASGNYTPGATQASGIWGFIAASFGSGGAPTALFPPGFYVYIENTGNGIFTINSQSLIDGSSSSVELGPNSGGLFVFDGTNWFTVRGMHLPIIIGNRQLFTVQAAAISATTLFSTPLKGMYRVSYEASVTQAATTSSSLGGTNGFQIKFTNGNGDAVVKTSNPTTPAISAGNTTGTTISGSLSAYCAASTNLQFLFDYTSSGATPMQYDLAVYAEYLGP